MAYKDQSSFGKPVIYLQSECESTNVQPLISNG